MSTDADFSRQLHQFVRDRDWEQFHNPKNLVMALAGEVGELTSVMQWMTFEEAEACAQGASADAVRDELADVFIYLNLLADRLGVDLVESARLKISRNESRYPSDLTRGRLDRYDTYGEGPISERDHPSSSES